MKARCFTLVELLVVIAIIALLVAVLAPFLQQSKQQAQAVLCGSNIKQLLMSFALYDTQNETLPYGLYTGMDPCNPMSPEDYPGDSTYDRMGQWWFQFIGGLNWEDKNKITVLYCPSKRLTKPSINENILCGNYGVNQSICKSTWSITGRSNWPDFTGTPLSYNNIQQPSSTLLLVDSGYSLITWWHACDNPPFILGDFYIEETAYVPGLWINSTRTLRPGQERDAIKGRHPNKTVNVGFVDGHVSRVKADELFVERMGVNDYKNCSPLWVPKTK